MKKIRILQTIRQGKIGGGESYLLELCKNLDRQRFEPEVLSFTDGEMIEELKSLGIRTHVVPTLTPFDVTVWNKVNRLCKEGGFDIVHAHGTRANSNTFWSSQQNNLPLIYTVHGWSFHDDQNWLTKALRIEAERFLTSKANTTVFGCKANLAEGRSHFELRDVDIIHNAVNKAKFEFDEKEKMLPENPTILYLARVTKQKDPKTMLLAFSMVLEELPNAKLLFVGDGELKSMSIEYAKHLGVYGNVEFRDKTTNVKQYLNQAHVYCLSSLWEGFPISLLEAMLMKTAVVATNVGGTPEMVRDYRTGLLCEPENPVELAERLVEILTNDDLRLAVQNTAYRFVRRNFLVRDQIKKIEALYLKTMDASLGA